jgi:hypothetical protein
MYYICRDIQEKHKHNKSMNKNQNLEDLAYSQNELNFLRKRITKVL